jgi:hypothetical protein
VAWLALLTTIVWWTAGGRAAAVGAILLPAIALAGLFALEREASVVDTARSWLMLRRARHRSRAWLQHERSDIAELLQQTYDWLSAEKPAPAAAQRPN